MVLAREGHLTCYCNLTWRDIFSTHNTNAQIETDILSIYYVHRCSETLHGPHAYALNVDSDFFWRGGGVIGAK